MSDTVGNAVRHAVSNTVRRELDDPSLLKTAAYVDGTWITADATLAVHNPSTGDLLAEVPLLDRARTASAIDAAHRALPAWRARPAKERSRLLRRWFDLVTAHAEDLARLIVLEEGKPYAEAVGEVAYAWRPVLRADRADRRDRRDGRHPRGDLRPGDPAAAVHRRE
ncbi:aldehyde dehydrogenase family protein [Streptomyces europaeiscabiei]|uniref:aldehyde dehydrogenase family protein n=1 Tax=Streptomyces europaeiscabiei TaxID=146819 RepID=UPI0038F72D67